MGCRYFCPTVMCIPITLAGPSLEGVGKSSKNKHIVLAPVNLRVGPKDHPCTQKNLQLATKNGYPDKGGVNGE